MNAGKNRIPDLLSWKYYSIVGLAFLSGLVLMLLAEGHDNNWLRFVGEVGAFVAAAVASHFIYDRLIRKDEQAFLIEKLESSIEEKMLTFEKNSGIISSDKIWRSEPFITGVTAAKNKVWILTTWMGHLVTVEGPLRQAIQRGVEVSILILNPKSMHAVERARELGIQNTDFVSREIHANLDRFAQFAAESGYPATFNVRLFDGHPILHIQAYDDIINCSLFLRNRNSLEAPWLSLKNSDESDLYFSRDVRNHFEAIWKGAMPIDFKDAQWRKKI